MKIYDISQEVFSSKVFPGDPKPKKEIISSMEKGDLYNLTAFSMCAHNGTHIDAPFHFYKDGKTIDEICLESFIGKAYIAEHQGIVTSEDAKNIIDIFETGEIARIYLNFSDPWPKDRHAKRRLTSTEFFARYDQILAKEGEVMFKTDNRILFDFSLEQVPEAGWSLKDVTFDLHHSEYAEGNIMTEYEEKFSSLGNPIFRLVAYR